MLKCGMQSLAGGVALLIAAVLAGEFHGFHFAVYRKSWLALVYLIVFGSALDSAPTSSFWRRAPGASGNLRVVNPVVALFLGWLILASPCRLRTFLAAGVILTA